jgi:cytochrome c biogenesis protein CcdA
MEKLNSTKQNKKKKICKKFFFFKYKNRKKLFFKGEEEQQKKRNKKYPLSFGQEMSLFAVAVVVAFAARFSLQIIILSVYFHRLSTARWLNGLLLSISLLLHFVKFISDTI